MGNKAAIEEEKRRRAEADRRRAEAEAEEARQRARKEEEIRKQKEAENERIRLLKEKREAEARELERRIQREREIERERRKREEEERRRREEEERRKREYQRRTANQKKIDAFKDNQNIATFLKLMEEFSRDYEFRMETLQALNEGKLISKYKECEKELEEKIEMVESTLEQDDGLSYPSQRKLLLIAFCQRKNKGKYDDILEKHYKNNKKNLLFNILLDYPKEFGDDIKFQGDEGEKIYKELDIEESEE